MGQGTGEEPKTLGLWRVVKEGAKVSIEHKKGREYFPYASLRSDSASLEMTYSPNQGGQWSPTVDLWPAYWSENAGAEHPGAFFQQWGEISSIREKLGGDGGLKLLIEGKVGALGCSGEIVFNAPGTLCDGAGNKECFSARIAIEAQPTAEFKLLPLQPRHGYRIASLSTVHIDPLNWEIQSVGNHTGAVSLNDVEAATLPQLKGKPVFRQENVPATPGLIEIRDMIQGDSNKLVLQGGGIHPTLSVRLLKPTDREIKAQDLQIAPLGWKTGYAYGVPNAKNVAVWFGTEKFVPHYEYTIVVRKAD